MERLPGPALLLSLGAHLALGLALGGGGLIGDAGAPVRHEPRTRLEARLGAADRRAAAPVPAPVPAPAAAPAAPKVEAAAPPGDETAAGESALLPVPSLPGAHYFGANELTEKPHVLRDIAPDQLRVLPDVVARPARARLLINELGGIDKVVIEDAFLSEQAARFVIDALEQIRFYPGKLGDMPVKSQLRIEVVLQHIVLASGNLNPPADPGALRSRND